MESVAEWVRTDQSLGLYGNVLCVVSRLTAGLGWGSCAAAVLSAPCCCGFCHLSQLSCVCTCVCLLWVRLCETRSVSFISEQRTSDRQPIRPHALQVDLWTLVLCLTKRGLATMLGQHLAWLSAAICVSANEQGLSKVCKHYCSCTNRLKQAFMCLHTHTHTHSRGADSHTQCKSANKQSR